MIDLSIRRLIWADIIRFSLLMSLRQKWKEIHPLLKRIVNQRNKYYSPKISLPRQENIIPNLTRKRILL